jgi:hypothetical protein
MIECINHSTYLKIWNRWNENVSSALFLDRWNENVSSALFWDRWNDNVNSFIGTNRLYLMHIVVSFAQFISLICFLLFFHVTMLYHNSQTQEQI